MSLKPLKNTIKDYMHVKKKIIILLFMQKGASLLFCVSSTLTI